jgi:opacity protein-like surface antigen
LQEITMKASMLQAAALAAALASPWAAAQGWAPGQAYAGIALGQSRAGFDCAGATECDRHAVGGKVYGGYMVHPNFGVEIDLRHHGKAELGGTAGSDEFRTYGMGLYALASLRQGSASLFGKLGLAAMRTSGVATVAGLGSPDRETDTRGAWGVGLAWDFSKNVSARIEFERIRVKLGGDKVDSDLVSAGVSTRF